MERLGDWGTARSGRGVAPLRVGLSRGRIEESEEFSASRKPTVDHDAGAVGLAVKEADADREDLVVRRGSPPRRPDRMLANERAAEGDRRPAGGLATDLGDEKEKRNRLRSGASVARVSTRQTVMTTFPLACPSSRYRMASGTSLSEYVLSITGVILPASMSSFRDCRSFLFGFTVKLIIFWLTNGDNARALTMRSTGPIQRPLDSPLINTSVPFGVSARLQSDAERVPANWRM